MIFRQITHDDLGCASYHDLHERPEELDARRPVAAICSSGQRAAVTASLLRRHGVA